MSPSCYHGKETMYSLSRMQFSIAELPRRPSVVSKSNEKRACLSCWNFFLVPIFLLSATKFGQSCLRDLDLISYCCL
jgi:hypothetical protein